MSRLFKKDKLPTLADTIKQYEKNHTNKKDKIKKKFKKVLTFLSIFLILILIKLDLSNGKMLENALADSKKFVTKLFDSPDKPPESPRLQLIQTYGSRPIKQKTSLDSITMFIIKTEIREDSIESNTKKQKRLTKQTIKNPSRTTEKYTMANNLNLVKVITTRQRNNTLKNNIQPSQTTDTIIIPGRQTIINKQNNPTKPGRR